MMWVLRAALCSILLKLSSTHQECFNVAGSLRLVNGYSELEGQAEVCLDGIWVSLCSSRELNKMIANVLCKSLGLSRHGAEFLTDQNVGNEVGGYTVSSCLSNGTCNFNSLDDVCEPASLKCPPVSCVEWEVRLVDSVGEVCMNETWTPISPTTDYTANLFCRQLGLSFYGARATRSDISTTSRDVVNIICHGGEASLSQCDATPTGSSTAADVSILQLTCQQKCHHCNDSSGVVEMKARGARILRVTWNFEDVLPLSSVLSYAIKCTSVWLSQTEISVQNIPPTSSFLELQGLELIMSPNSTINSSNLSHITCCISAHQRNSTFVVCATSVTDEKFPVEVIAGMAAGILAAVVIIILFATLPVVYYCKKRSIGSDKKRKRELIRASLNDLFSKSSTLTGAGSSSASKTNTDQEAAQSGPDIPGLRDNIVVSECVAYTTAIHASTQLGQVYEDVPL